MARGQQPDAHRPQWAIENDIFPVHGFIPSLRVNVSSHRIQMDPDEHLGLSNLDLCFKGSIDQNQYSKTCFLGILKEENKRVGLNKRVGPKEV